MIRSFTCPDTERLFHSLAVPRFSMEIVDRHGNRGQTTVFNSVP